MFIYQKQRFEFFPMKVFFMIFLSLFFARAYVLSYNLEYDSSYAQNLHKDGLFFRFYQLALQSSVLCDSAVRFGACSSGGVC